jgi:TPR repeat protein
MRSSFTGVPLRQKLPLFTCVAVMALLGAKAASGQGGTGAHSTTLAAAPFQPAGDFVAVQKDVRQISPLALAELRRSAESGDRISQNNLAYLYTFGAGLPRDDQEAAKWYAASAAQGLPAAQYNLGVLYEHGRECPRITRKLRFTTGARHNKVTHWQKLEWGLCMSAGGESTGILKKQ